MAMPDKQKYTNEPRMGEEDDSKNKDIDSKKEFFLSLGKEQQEEAMSLK